MLKSLNILDIRQHIQAMIKTNYLGVKSFSKSNEGDIF